MLSILSKNNIEHKSLRTWVSTTTLKLSTPWIPNGENLDADDDESDEEIGEENCIDEYLKMIWSLDAPVLLFLLSTLPIFQVRQATKFLSWSVPFSQLQKITKDRCVWCHYLMLPSAFWYASKISPKSHLIDYLRISRWVLSMGHEAVRHWVFVRMASLDSIHLRL